MSRSYVAIYDDLERRGELDTWLATKTPAWTWRWEPLADDDGTVWPISIARRVPHTYTPPRWRP